MNAIDMSREYANTDNEDGLYAGNMKAKFKSADEERAWARTQTKECKDCKETLPLTYFGGNSSSADHFNRDGIRLRRGECTRCSKLANQGKTEAKKLAKSLGMPFKAPVGTACELCHSTDSIVFDHDHVTKSFRGWLCDPCNRSMGRLGDSVEGLLKCVNYLNKNEKKKITVDPETGILSITN
jgi:hypothetical protein